MLKALREKYWKRVSFLFVANEATLMLPGDRRPS